MKRFAIALAMAVLAAGSVAAQAVEEPAATISSEMEIGQFIQQFARMTDMTFIVDPRVNGTVVTPSNAPVSRDELLDFFVDTLRASGVTAVPSVGGAYRIFPAADSVQRTSAHLALPAGAVRL